MRSGRGTCNVSGLTTCSPTSPPLPPPCPRPTLLLALPAFGYFRPPPVPRSALQAGEEGRPSLVASASHLVSFATYPAFSCVSSSSLLSVLPSRAAFARCLHLPERRPALQAGRQMRYESHLPFAPFICLFPLRVASPSCVAALVRSPWLSTAARPPSAPSSSFRAAAVAVREHHATAKRKNGPAAEKRQNGRKRQTHRQNNPSAQPPAECRRNCGRTAAEYVRKGWKWAEMRHINGGLG